MMPSRSDSREDTPSSLSPSSTSPLSIAHSVPNAALLANTASVAAMIPAPADGELGQFARRSTADRSGSRSGRRRLAVWSYLSILEVASNARASEFAGRAVHLG